MNEIKLNEMCARFALHTCATYASLCGLQGRFPLHIYDFEYYCKICVIIELWGFGGKQVKGKWGFALNMHLHEWGFALYFL